MSTLTIGLIVLGCIACLALGLLIGATLIANYLIGGFVKAIYPGLVK